MKWIRNDDRGRWESTLDGEEVWVSDVLLNGIHPWQMLFELGYHRGREAEKRLKVASTATKSESSDDMSDA